MRVLGVVGIGSKQQFYLIFFYHIEDVVELGLLELGIEGLLILVSVTETFTEPKLDLIIRIQQQNRGHHV